MNFYELFEKKEEKDAEKYQDVSIADPKAAYALRQARAKYTYADSDLEAFVKMTQDKEEEEDKEIEKIERDTERQEDEIKSLEKEVNDLELGKSEDSAKINRLEKENDLQEKSIKLLAAKEKQYEKMAKSYSDWAAKLESDLTDLELRLQRANLKGFSPAKRGQKVAIPEPDLSVDLGLDAN